MSRQFIATSAEVTPKGSLVRESYLFTAPTRGAAVRRKGILPKMALIHVRIYDKSPRYVYLFIYIFMVIYIYLYIYILYKPLSETTINPVLDFPKNHRELVEVMPLLSSAAVVCLIASGGARRSRARLEVTQGPGKCKRWSVTTWAPCDRYK